MSAGPEFSRPVPLPRIAAQPLRHEIAASETEREALARRFGLLALDRLVAAVELRRENSDTVLLSASFEAAFAQECVVTLEPIETSVAERFSLRYGSPDREPQAAGADDEPAFEPLEGETIDIGEAVAQEFSLALPVFPRAPGVSAEMDEASAPAGPLAELSRLLAARRP